MSDIYKFGFETITGTFSLPVGELSAYIIFTIIAEMTLKLSFNSVGRFYSEGLIEGREAGSFLHWTFRLIYYSIFWFIAYCSIKAYYFISDNWQIILMIIGSIAGAAMLCTLAVTAIRFFKKHRTVNGNA